MLHFLEEMKGHRKILPNADPKSFMMRIHIHKMRFCSYPDCDAFRITPFSSQRLNIYI